MLAAQGMWCLLEGTNGLRPAGPHQGQGGQAPYPWPLATLYSRERGTLRSHGHRCVLREETPRCPALLWASVPVFERAQRPHRGL